MCRRQCVLLQADHSRSKQGRRSKSSVGPVPAPNLTNYIFPLAVEKVVKVIKRGYGNIRMNREETSSPPSLQHTHIQRWILDVLALSIYINVMLGQNTDPLLGLRCPTPFSIRDGSSLPAMQNCCAHEG